MEAESWGVEVGRDGSWRCLKMKLKVSQKHAYDEASLYIYMYDWIDAEIIVQKPRIMLCLHMRADLQSEHRAMV